MLGMIFIFKIFLFMIVANSQLIMLGFELCVLISVRIIEVRFVFIDNYLMRCIEIEIVITGRQYRRSDPVFFCSIYVLTLWHIVVHINIGQVIIINMVVTYRSPNGLHADIGNSC